MLDYPTINRSALAQLPMILPDLLPGGKILGREYRCGGLSGGDGQSFGINLETGRWSDFATGDAGGDVIGLIAVIKGLSQSEAARLLSERIGMPSGTPQRKVVSTPPRLPQPAGTIPETITHPRLGQPSSTWAYRNASGEVLGIICRFDTADGKEVIPYTFGADGWQWKGWTAPRPLYGLDRLTARPNAPVLIVEGEKAADAAQRLISSVVAITWPGGSNAVAKSDFSSLKGRRVAIWPDADDPGRRAMEALTETLQNVGAAEVYQIAPPLNVTKGWDLADAESEGWTAEKVTQWIKENRKAVTETGKSDPAKLVFISAAVLCVRSVAIPWIIKDFLSEEMLALLFGGSGCGKSFLVLDWLLSIASQKSEWAGTPIKKHGPVFYLCGEGHAGLGRRIKAWCLKHSIDPQTIKFFASNQSVAMLNQESVSEMMVAIDFMAATHGQPLVITIDTLNRNFGEGDENSTSDMTGFVSAVDAVKNKYRCSVLIVHHTGLGDGSRSRGSSALRGSLDAEFRLSVQDDNRILTCTKLKDAEPPQEIHLVSEKIDLKEVDEDLRPITSIVMTRTDAPAKSFKRISGTKRIALQALHAVRDPETGRVHIDNWRAESYSRGISTSENIEAKKKAFSRAVKDLLEDGHVHTRDDYYWPESIGEGQGDKTGQSGTMSPVVPVA